MLREVLPLHIEEQVSIERQAVSPIFEIVSEIPPHSFSVETFLLHLRRLFILMAHHRRYPTGQRHGAGTGRYTRHSVISLVSLFCTDLWQHSIHPVLRYPITKGEKFVSHRIHTRATRRKRLVRWRPLTSWRSLDTLSGRKRILAGYKARHTFMRKGTSIQLETPLRTRGNQSGVDGIALKNGKGDEWHSACGGQE